MFDEFSDDPRAVGTEEAFSILQEVERNTPDEIRRQRAHFRVSVKARAILQPGNASDLLDFKVQGVTGDISEGGLGAIFPIAARVGDIYRIELDRTQVDLPLTFVRCARCRLVRESAFEAGFTFFAPIALPENLAAADASP